MWIRVALPLVALALAGPHGARAFEMSRKDRMAVLYSNQVVFDRKGEPLVSVRVSEEQTRVQVTSRAALTLLPGGDDGHRIAAPAGARWTVTIEDGKPGRRRWWVVVARVPAADLARAAATRDRWRERGHEVSLFESGALIGLAGRTLDTRVVTVAVDPRPTEAEARAHAAALAADEPLPGEVVAEPLARPGGWIVAREASSGVEVRARDLLWATTGGGAPIDLPDLEWGHGTPRRGREDRSYDGDVYFTVGHDGRLAVVNLVEAERLLEAVVPSELFPSAPHDALRAQAVAARGQLLAKIGTRHRADPYLLCAETHCQAYGGRRRQSPRTSRAVRDTRGELLFDDRGLVDTVYSAACGGHGEAFHLTWGGEPQPALLGRPDTPEAAGPSPIEDARVPAFVASPPEAAWCRPSGERAGVFRWTATRTGDQVTRAVNERRAIGPVVDIRPLRRGRSGRALAIEYVGERGRHVVEGEYANRVLLGNLRSGLWTLERDGPPGAEPRAWRFHGGGFGHGVGLCQHGAMGMARAGLDYRRILRHYYPGSRLEKVW